MGPPAKVELLLGTTRAANMLNYGGLKSEIKNLISVSHSNNLILTFAKLIADDKEVS